MADDITFVDVGKFDGIEATDLSNEFVRWMEQQRADGPDLLVDQLGISSHDRVLDVGCGPGVDLARLASQCDAAIGLDVSISMATSARDRAHDRRALVMVGDGRTLPMRSGSVDACMCRAVLVHCDNPQSVIDEIARVLTPGGRVALSEPDHGSHLVSTSETEVFERIKAHRRGRFRNPLVGRNLPELVTTAGLRLDRSWAFPITHRSLHAARSAGGPFDVAVEAAVADGAISADEAARYIGSLEDLDRRGAFFFAAMSVAVTASLDSTGDDR